MSGFGDRCHWGAELEWLELVSGCPRLGDPSCKSVPRSGMRTRRPCLVFVPDFDSCVDPPAQWLFALGAAFPARNTLKTLLFIVVALIILGLLVAAASRRKSGRGDDPWPFYAKKLLSAPEQILYHRMVKVLPEHIVLAQVQVSRVLGVKKGFNFREWNNRINRLSYDFVVCSKDSTVLFAVELDDKSHEAKARSDTDRKKDAATKAAGVRLVRWNVASLPDEQAIRAVIEAGIWA